MMNDVSKYSRIEFHLSRSADPVSSIDDGAACPLALENYERSLWPIRSHSSTPGIVKRDIPVRIASCALEILTQYNCLCIGWSQSLECPAAGDFNLHGCSGEHRRGMRIGRMVRPPKPCRTRNK